MACSANVCKTVGPSELYVRCWMLVMRSFMENVLVYPILLPWAFANHPTTAVGLAPRALKKQRSSLNSLSSAE